MNNLKQIFIKYKKAFLILGIILLGWMLLFMGNISKNEGILPKIIVRPPEKEEESGLHRKSFSVVKTEPILGRTVKNSADLVKIYLNYPIDDSKIEFTVNPKIELLFKTHNEADKKVLSMFPLKAGWVQDTLYTITINKLEGPEDVMLKTPITLYYYFFREPKTEGGESWMSDPNVDEDALREYLRGHHDYERIFGEPPQW